MDQSGSWLNTRLNLFFFSEVVKVPATQQIFTPIAPKLEPGSPEEKRFLQEVCISNCTLRQFYI